MDLVPGAGGPRCIGNGALPQGICPRLFREKRGKTATRTGPSTAVANGDYSTTRRVPGLDPADGRESATDSRSDRGVSWGGVLCNGLIPQITSTPWMRCVV